MNVSAKLESQKHHDSLAEAPARLLDSTPGHLGFYVATEILPHCTDKLTRELYGLMFGNSFFDFESKFIRHPKPPNFVWSLDNLHSLTLR